MEHGCEERGAKPFAGNVGDDKRCAVLAHGEDVEVVASHRQAGEIDAGDAEMREIAEAARKKRLLDIAGDADFLLHALAFALAFDESRVVENARGFDRERVQNPPVEPRESGGTSGIEIYDAKEIAAFILHGRIRGAGPRRGVERNHDDDAEALRDDAFRRLKIPARLRKILGDDALLLIHRLTQCSLAGSCLRG